MKLYAAHCSVGFEKINFEKKVQKRKTIWFQVRPHAQIQSGGAVGPEPPPPPPNTHWKITNSIDFQKNLQMVHTPASGKKLDPPLEYV